MINRLVHQVVAFGLATVFTVGVFGSINLLATHPADAQIMAAHVDAKHAASVTSAAEDSQS